MKIHGVVVLFLSIFVHCYEVCAQSSVQLRFVAAGIANGRAQWRCFQAKVTYHETFPKEVSAYNRSHARVKDVWPLDDVNRTDVAQWSYQAPKLSFNLQYDRSNGREIHTVLKVTSDGQEVREFTGYKDGRTPTRGEYFRGMVTAAASRFDDGLLTAQERFDPRAFVYYTEPSPAGKPLDQLFLESQSSPYPQAALPADGHGVTGRALHLGEEVVEDSRCAKIELMNYGPGAPKGVPTRYWIDTEHGFLLRRLEEYEPLGDGSDRIVLRRQVRVPRIVQDNGVWSAAEVEKKEMWTWAADKVRAAKKYPPGLSVESFHFNGEFATLPPAVDTITISDFKANCEFTPDAFEMIWPKGTSVQDEVRQRSFKVQADGSIQTSIETKTEALPSAESDPANVIAPALPLVNVGQPSPEFTATDMNGKAWKLSELKGQKNLLLTFFPKCFTGGCANHLSSLRDQQAEFDAADTQILAVSVDAADGERGQKAFAQQWQLGFPLIPDTQRTLSRLFGAAQNDQQLAARMSILIDKQGIVQWVDTNVQVRTHGADVLTKMRELKLIP